MPVSGAGPEPSPHFPPILGWWRGIARGSAPTALRRFPRPPALCCLPRAAPSCSRVAFTKPRVFPEDDRFRRRRQVVCAPSLAAARASSNMAVWWRQSKGAGSQKSGKELHAVLLGRRTRQAQPSADFTAHSPCRPTADRRWPTASFQISKDQRTVTTDGGGFSNRASREEARSGERGAGRCLDSLQLAPCSELPARHGGKVASHAYELSQYMLVSTRWWTGVKSPKSATLHRAFRSPIRTVVG